MEIELEWLNGIFAASEWEQPRTGLEEVGGGNV